MKKETQKRIKYYKHVLPGLKSKVFAAASMALVATVTAVSATYAWVTLSVSPEVRSIDTTVTANGSLEIALANGTGKAPGKSGAGDSTAAGKSLLEANLKWGNQVNLTDPSYGLDKVTLRPAAKNGTTGLLTNPLYGVGYGKDGRVSEMVTGDDFAYAYFDPTSGETGKFLVDVKGDHLGVRAISTVQWENTEGGAQAAALLKLANQNWNTAKNSYTKIVDETKEPGKSYITSLQGLIQVYAQNVLDKKPTNELVIDAAYISNLNAMMQDVYQNVMQPMGESYVQLANLLEMYQSGNQDAGYTVDTLVNAYRQNKLPAYIKDNLPNFGTFAGDYASLRDTYLKGSANGTFSDLTQSQKNSSLPYWAYFANGGGTVYWSNLSGIINWICNISTATLDGYTLSQMSNLSTALSILNGSNHKAVIKGGEIFRLENGLGEYMSPTIKVTVDPSAITSLVKEKTLSAVLTTAANPTNDNMDDPLLSQDIETVKSKNTGSFKGDTATAQDTYALALDLWLRTNAGADASAQATTVVSEGTAQNGNGEDVAATTTTVTQPERAYLTLEGTVLYKMVEKQQQVEDANKEMRDVYTATVTLGSEKMEVETFERYGQYYVKDDNGREVELSQYIKNSYGTSPSNVTYTPKITQQQVVSGYEGTNRIWNDEQMAPFAGEATSTTQGGGSCYIFYADNEADQKRFLQLLDSMRVVFVDGNGRQIGSARMDTENYYAESGKVTVPLKLDTSSAINLGYDGDQEVYGLMELPKNAATRVTALVYLDGTRLTNEMVLANGDIQGALNVQFSTWNASQVTETTTDTEGNELSRDTYYQHGSDNESIKDESIMGDTVSVSAKVDKNDFNGATLPASTGVHITVAGIEPSSVQAKFIRAISSTQGVLQDPIILTKNGDTWDGTLTLNKPGNYKLRSAWINGVEYALDGGQEITVTVPGYSVNSVGCDALPAGSRQTTIMTAESSVSTQMTLGFASNETIKTSLTGVFMSDDGRQVNVPFTLKGGVWAGTATFNTSGTYTMKYVEVDGDPYALNEELQPTLQILLGLRAGVTISADVATQARLQSVFPGALPTNFVMDSGKLGGSVTLTTSVKLYDNSGNEIPALTGAKLRYGRVGSALLAQGLDCDLTWNASTQSYEGNFIVSRAGSFAFSQVEINLNGKTSMITASTSASKIQAMPPDDASYFNNYTEAYQFSPNKAGSITIGIAYSSAATKVEGTLVNGSKTEMATAQMGEEADDQGDKSVNKWSFTLPDEGNWQLTDITLYGVYYNSKYVGDEGVKIDLTKENIQAKYVKTLYTTLSGTNQSFTGYFMDDHKVTDMTVTIQDFEGQPILNHTISNVKVTYLRGAVGLNTDYGYESDSTAEVSGTGSLQNGSSTVFALSEMNFQQAGPYTNAQVSFALDGQNITANTAGSNGAKLSYTVNGKASDTCPQFDVKWNAPKAYVSYYKQPYIDNSGNCSSLKYYEYSGSQVADPYKIDVWWQRSGLMWYFPIVKFQLENAGNYAKNAELKILLQAQTSGQEDYTKTAAFNASGESNEVPLGKIKGNSDSDESGVRSEDQWRTSKITLNEVEFIKDSVTYKLKLGKEIVINTGIVDDG